MYAGLSVAPERLDHVLGARTTPERQVTENFPWKPLQISMEQFIDVAMV